MTLLLKGLPLFLCSFSGHLELVQKIFEKSSLVAGFLSNFCTEQKIKSLNHHQHFQLTKTVTVKGKFIHFKSFIFTFNCNTSVSWR